MTEGQDDVELAEGTRVRTNTLYYISEPQCRADPYS